MEHATTDDGDTPSSSKHLEELAEAHDLDVEQVKAISDASISECWECGRSEEDIDPITMYPVGDGETALLCHECYAEYLADVTTLSEPQAAAWALYAAGFERTEIDTHLGNSPGQSHSAIRRAQEKAEASRVEVEKHRATIELIGDQEP